jgi:hypothetical protein
MHSVAIAKANSLSLLALSSRPLFGMPQKEHVEKAVFFARFDSPIVWGKHGHGMFTLDPEQNVPLGVIGTNGEFREGADTWSWRGKKTEFPAFESWFRRVAAEAERRRVAALE